MKETYLTLSYPNFLPDEKTSDLLENFASKGFTLTVKKRTEHGPYAMMDWLVPTMLVLYVTKPFYESFLKEAGKESFIQVKEWMKKVLREGHQSASNEASKRPSETYFQSSYVSIGVDLKHGKKLKILFDKRLTLDDWKSANDLLMDRLAIEYDSFESKIVCKSTLFDSIGDHSKIYAVMNVETKEWEILTDREMIQHQIELSRKINADLDKAN